MNHRCEKTFGELDHVGLKHLPSPPQPFPNPSPRNHLRCLGDQRDCFMPKDVVLQRIEAELIKPLDADVFFVSRLAESDAEQWNETGPLVGSLF